MSGATEPLVSLRGVGFAYRGEARPALRGVDLDIGRGEMVAVMGASGSGKTTLARCIQRSLPAYQPGELLGEVRIGGERRNEQRIDDLVGVVGLVTEDFEAQLFSTNVVAEVVFALEQMGLAQAEMEERVAAALELVGLCGFEQRDPTTLSGGEKQRLSIAAVLAMRPQVLLFDEPTTDLDPLGKEEIFAVLRTLRDRGYAILLIEHEIGAAEGADRLVILAEGEIAESARPAHLLGKVERLRELGVRPPDLDRVAAALGRPRFRDLAEAVEIVRPLWCPPAMSAATPDRPAEALIEMRDVRFCYPGGGEVLRGVDLRIGAGEVVALVGPNGCGKTTLSKHLNGLLRPARGTVLRRGADMRAQALAEIARDVAYVFQDPDQQIFASSVRDEVRFALDNRGGAAAEDAARVEATLARVGLLEHADADPFLLGKGLRQRLAVASMLVLEPALLILDEPTTGLDDAEQRGLMALVEELARTGTAVLMITHAPWVVAEHARRCVAMAQGRILFDGPTASFLADAALMRRSDFTPPQATRLAVALGGVARCAEDVLASLAPAGAWR